MLSLKKPGPGFESHKQLIFCMYVTSTDVVLHNRLRIIENTNLARHVSAAASA